jgi:hypothetical protein
VILAGGGLLGWWHAVSGVLEQTTKTVGPSDVVANHRIKCRDHLPHHRHDHDLRQFAGTFQTIVKEFEQQLLALIAAM